MLYRVSFRHVTLLLHWDLAYSDPFFTCPLWLVKTRMQLYELKASHEHSLPQYRSLTHGLRTIVQTEGIRGLYRGLPAQLLLVVHPSIQFSVYEPLKTHCRNHLQLREGEKLPNVWVMLCTSAAKTCAAIATTPITVIKVRIQDLRNSVAEVKYTSLRSASSIIYRREGVRGFFRGTGPAVWRTLPGAVITFVSYENISHRLRVLTGTSV
eukprot:NODE_1382_length_1560_cov_28.075447_g1244_i0.p1 GENE.NODE_1382_length_1560_cov_28.075447_g1244_i0~~NODE_1382_length_1560_cov_28.075447_g1244_i0.p1  ORF type:complete len:210 (-),score=26.95 NODE_1382_length_1560_cov_28.075447_g1244_i0:472-1101(-)